MSLHGAGVADVAGEANSRLIAAAPDLLTGLREELEALRIWDRDTSVPSDIAEGISISIDKIEAAIAKVEEGE
jgi:hypothetical protein